MNLKTASLLALLGSLIHIVYVTVGTFHLCKVILDYNGFVTTFSAFFFLIQLDYQQILFQWHFEDRVISLVFAICLAIFLFSMWRRVK